MLLLFLGGTGSALALEITYPRLPGATPPQDFLQTASPEQVIPLYVVYIFNLVIWVSGLLALGVLTWAGIRFLTSAGKPEAIISAKKQISSAFLGIMLLLSSFLILRIINTQLVVLTIQEAEQMDVIERPEVGSPPTEFYRSSINVELVYDEVIKNVFGSSTEVTSKPATTSWSASSSMERIKALSASTSAIAHVLQDQTDDMKKKLYWCGCFQADPDCQGCSTYCTADCTCDVCDSVRSDLNDLEEKNLQRFDDFRPVQIYMEDEIRLLKAEIAKVERLQKFMLECKLAALNSRAENLDSEKYYISNNWPFWNFKFWDAFATSSALDWRNWYCPVSGTIWGGYESFALQPITEGYNIADLPQEAEEEMACRTEIPVGDILDRAIKISNALVQKMQLLNGLSKDMIDETNELHRDVSRCSSQQPMCCSFCIRIYGVCIKLCIGVACPWSDIKHQLEKIEDIEELIQLTVYGPEGIVFIIDKAIPKLLEDLNNYVYLINPLKECISESAPEAAQELAPVILADCESALRAVGPTQRVIQNCCLNEPEFQKCLKKCALKLGQEEYKKCLYPCLQTESQDLRSKGKTQEAEIIATCSNKINYYCCGK